MSLIVRDEDRIRRILSENLLYYIRMSGKTMQQIANETGISKGALSNYCSGYRYPRPEQLQTIAAYFKIPVSNLTASRDSTEEGLSNRARYVGQSFDLLDDRAKQIIEGIIRNELARMQMDERQE